MNFFFDNCTPLRIARTINGFVQADGSMACHIRNAHDAGLPLSSNARDTAWIETLGDDKREWIVVTADRKISTNPTEKEAFRMAKLKGFLLKPGYRNAPVHQQASNLLWHWPELMRFITNFAPPVLVDVPQSRDAALKAVQW